MTKISQYGLIGSSLKHSFSSEYFNNKFKKNKLDLHYKNYELSSVEEFLILIEQNPQLKGLNVTFPFKERVIPYLTEIKGNASDIKAVNVISIYNNRLIGYNTDVDGFRMSLKKNLDDKKHNSALILGHGGASKAVQFALSQMQIPFHVVGRLKEENILPYDELDEKSLQTHNIIINTTPLGTFPHNDACPDIPYHYLTKSHLLFDLVYNPSETLFMKKGIENGARVCNGYEMLKNQAELTWEIWNPIE